MMTWRKIEGHLLTTLTFVLAFLFFFPILWMVLTSFKTEADAFSFPPQILFNPTFENYSISLGQAGYLDHLGNTLIITTLATLVAVILGVPAAYALAFYPGKRNNFTLTWVMSTRMLPPVGVIVPLYVIFNGLGIMDSYPGMILIYSTMNLPLVIWMMRSFFVDLPYEVIEAARIDGANLIQELGRVILPLALPGLMATILLCFIFVWNEFFFAFNLAVSHAAPLSVFISFFKTAEGLFWAKMSAAATLTALPVIIVGWIAQRQLVRGLTAGAIK